MTALNQHQRQCAAHIFQALTGHIDDELRWVSEHDDGTGASVPAPGDAESADAIYHHVQSALMALAAQLRRTD